MNESRCWVHRRLILLAALGAICAYTVNLVPVTYSFASWPVFPSVAAFALAATSFVLRYQQMSSSSFAVWVGPTWWNNPFSLRYPLQMWAFAGEVLLVTGVTSLSVDVLHGSRSCSWEFPLASSIGILVAVRLCRPRLVTAQALRYSATHRIEAKRLRR